MIQASETQSNPPDWVLHNSASEQAWPSNQGRMGFCASSGAVACADLLLSWSDGHVQGSFKNATAGTDIQARVLDVNPADGIVDLSLSARFLAKPACSPSGIPEVLPLLAATL